MDSEEVWAAVSGFEGVYEVSDLGRVRRTLNPTTKDGLLKPIVGTAGKGYLSVGLCRNGVQHWRYVHRLVAKAFCNGETRERKEVNHKDGNTKNNLATNLEFCTHSEQMKHAVATGLFNPTANIWPKGRDKYRRYKGTRLTASDVIEIRRRHLSGERVCDLAREYGVNYYTVWSAMPGRSTWKHIGEE